MAKYQVTMTQTVDVVARNEEHAFELANWEIENNPDFEREIECIAKPEMANIASELEKRGYTVKLDKWGNNSADIIRINYTSKTVDYHGEDFEFALVMNLDERFETYDGTGYTLATYGDEIISIGHHPDYVVARLVENALEARRPHMVATLDEIVECLTASGVTATVVDFGRYEGQPCVIEIGNTEGFSVNGEPVILPEFTLYQNLSDDGTIAGTGYHLSFEDDEAQVIAEIGNETAPRIVFAIATAIATAKERANLS